jgi:hypothetical protein
LARFARSASSLAALADVLHGADDAPRLLAGRLGAADEVDVLAHARRRRQLDLTRERHALLRGTLERPPQIARRLRRTERQCRFDRRPEDRRVGAEDAVHLVGPRPDARRDVERPAADAGDTLRFGQQDRGPLQGRRQLLAHTHLLAQFEVRDHLATERFEGLELLRAQVAHAAIDHADRAHGATVRCDDRRTGIEADVGIAGDERVVGKALVFTGVPHDEHAVVEDRVRAEGDFARRLAHIEADDGLEPLPIRIDEADDRDRHVADARRERHDVVVDLLGQGVEDVVPPQRLESLLLVGRQGCAGHGGGSLRERHRRTATRIWTRMARLAQHTMAPRDRLLPCPGRRACAGADWATPPSSAACCAAPW